MRTLKICLIALISLLLLTGCEAANPMLSLNAIQIVEASQEIEQYVVYNKPKELEIKWNNVIHTIKCGDIENKQVHFKVNGTEVTTKKGTMVCIYLVGAHPGITSSILDGDCLGIPFYPDTCNVVTQKGVPIGPILPKAIMDTCQSLVIKQDKTVEKDPVQEDTLWGMPNWCRMSPNKVFNMPDSVISWTSECPEMDIKA